MCVRVSGAQLFAASGGRARRLGFHSPPPYLLRQGSPEVGGSRKFSVTGQAHCVTEVREPGKGERVMASLGLASGLTRTAQLPTASSRSSEGVRQQLVACLVWFELEPHALLAWS